MVDVVGVDVCCRVFVAGYFAYAHTYLNGAPFLGASYVRGVLCAYWPYWGRLDGLVARSSGLPFASTINSIALP